MNNSIGAEEMGFNARKGTQGGTHSLSLTLEQGCLTPGELLHREQPQFEGNISTELILNYRKRLLVCKIINLVFTDLLTK